jgi:hypothetical protein
VLNVVYTAADHCQLTCTPGVSVVNVAFHVTGLIPPGKPAAGTWKTAPVRKSLPDVLVGAAVTHAPLEKVVVAVVAPGVSVIVASGTASE